MRDLARIDRDPPDVFSLRSSASTARERARERIARSAPSRRQISMDSFALSKKPRSVARGLDVSAGRNGLGSDTALASDTVCADDTVGIRQRDTTAAHLTHLVDMDPSFHRLLVALAD